MSRRNRSKKTPPSRPPIAAMASAPLTEADKEGKRRDAEIKWIKFGVFATIAAAFVGSATAPLLTAMVEDWRAPVLQFRSSEIILLDGRVAGAVINNLGKNPAKEVTLVIDAFMPDFKFTEAHHIHVMPPMAIDKELKGNRVEIRLKAPLGSEQTVSIMLDELYYKPLEVPLFMVSVSSDRGQAVSQGQDVRNVALKTRDFADQILGPGSLNYK